MHIEKRERAAADVLIKTTPAIIEQFLFEPKTNKTLYKIGRRMTDVMYETGYWDDVKSNFNPVIPGVNLNVQYTDRGIDIVIRFPNIENLKFSV